MGKGAKKKSADERGPVAQLGARFNGIEEVAGSTPARSTIFLIQKPVISSSK